MEEKKEFNYTDTDKIQTGYDPIRSLYPETMIIQSKVIADMLVSDENGVKSTNATRKLINELFGTENVKAEEKEPEEEWIWVQGYKGTDKYMQCRGYQYELNKKYDMPDDATIRVCDNGFHFCRKLNSVFTYYDVKNNNRFFKVSALVRKKDYDKIIENIDVSTWHLSLFNEDKLAAKSIIFLEEVSDDELFKLVEQKKPGFKDVPKELRYLAKERGVGYAITQYKIKTLIADGYSEAFAKFVVTDLDAFESAHQVASVPDLSMDMKALCICRGYYEDPGDWMYGKKI